MTDPKYQHGFSEAGWMEQNDTPRTDAAQPQLHSNVGGWVRADFARELERELTEKTNEVARLKKMVMDAAKRGDEMADHWKERAEKAEALIQQLHHLAKQLPKASKA